MPDGPLRLPGVDPANAPTPDDPEYSDWVESVVFSPEGVDLLQIEASLRRTPEERLAFLEATVAQLLRLRGGKWPEVR